MTEVLNAEQIEFYDVNGYIVLEKWIPESTILAIRSELDRFAEMARSMTASDERLDLEDSHTPEDPRIRRVKQPDSQSEVIRDLMYSDRILAPVRDLIGPDVRLHTSKLNMKDANHGAAVEWHQDYAFYPHTNDDLLAVGVMIDDMKPENGPLMIFPGSHRGPVYDHHVDGVFAGAMLPEENGLDFADAVQLLGPAGSISIHHGRIIHGSALNRSDRPRRLLLYEMMAADAFPVFGSMTTYSGIEEYNSKMLCGTPTLQPRLKDIPVRIPLPLPRKSGSIYEVQKTMKSRAFDVFG